MLAEARAHRDAMETLVLPDPKKWLCIAGVNTKTRVSMTIDQDAQSKIWFNVEDEVDEFKKGETPAGGVRTGDGTVPFLGAQCAFIPKNQIICVTPGDYDFFEVGDKVLNTVGLHAN